MSATIEQLNPSVLVPVKAELKDPKEILLDADKDYDKALKLNRRRNIGAGIVGIAGSIPVAAGGFLLAHSYMEGLDPGELVTEHDISDAIVSTAVGGLGSVAIGLGLYKGMQWLQARRAEARQTT